eukprot:TRINITY_DN30222_c0_g1_i1.p1 TRINITY_DN30222_c0_g1~~TRINITY_DN30222_c0_g1_i1.p1  ORF type:complete len:338 (+),score=67.88 TRINITY_DN30222_c0_g1_i1:144-1157(+)
MDATDKDLGWEDAAEAGGGCGSAGAGPVPWASSSGAGNVPASAQMLGSGATPGISDAVTSAMVSHFAREFTSSSLSLLPGFMESVRRYFNVNHGYVLRKMAWQLVPLSNSKKKTGELGDEKDWTARVFEGLEVEIEEPDMYIPTMGFVTYVLLCGLVCGLRDKFTPEFLSATITYALVALILETTAVKAALFMSGAAHAPIVDVAGILAYKFFYLSLHIMFGVLVGHGGKPTGFIFSLVALLLAVSAGVALWQALRRLARLQPQQSQECMTDLHQMCIKALPLLQAFVYWCLLPPWPTHVVQPAAAKVVTVVVTAVASSTTKIPAIAAAAGNLSSAQ